MCFEAFSSASASFAPPAPEGVRVKKGHNVAVYYAEGAEADAYVAPAVLESLYHYDAFDFGGHAQTILAALFRRGPEGLGEHVREEVTADDGGLFALDFVHPADPDGATAAALQDPATPVLLLLPGLTGGSADRYIRFCAQHALAGGFRPVVFCPRGSSGLPLRTAQFYSASFTGDVRQALAILRARYPAAPLFAAGWSLGANILVRYLGEEGPRAPLAGAASLANPWDLVACDANFRSGPVQRMLYDPKLATAMRGMFEPHASLFESCPRRSYDVPSAMRASTVREWDEAVTVRTFGWRDTSHYYSQSSSALSLPHVDVPLLCISALDDPIAVGHAIPLHALPNNERVAIAVTRRGGHNGWQTSGDPFGAPWTDVPVIDFFRRLLAARPNSSATCTHSGGSTALPPAPVPAPVPAPAPALAPANPATGAAKP